MKSLLTLHLSVLHSEGRDCSVDITRDAKSITRRWEHEGDSFLTITLPRLAKALERGLELGSWPAQDVTEFSHVRGLPAIMRGFLSRVFDPVDGVLLTSPDPNCIRAVRQVCYLTNKIERPCSPEREAAAFNQFVSTDRELMYLPGRIDPERLATFKKVSHRLFGRMFLELDRKIASWELLPKHGPGAVADRLSQSERRTLDYWPERLERVFPRWRYASNLPKWEPAQIQPVSINEELPVRVVSVPKTQSVPRIIAIEPSAMQYAQQGLKREIYALVERGPLGKVLGFQDQTRNREMARLASINRDLATLDLSEASDRVHWFLVHSMFDRHPHLREFVMATRSARADVPGHGVIPLSKFASMGSALTFPLEAMVFTILLVCAWDAAERSQHRVQDLPGRISVYGDDLIIPVHVTDCAIDWLSHFGAKVNRAKSFYKGGFRESCGAEYYNGHDVTVVRARQELPSSRNDATGIAALVDLRNRAYSAGLWHFVRDLDRSLEDLMRIPVARSTPTTDCGFIHRRTYLPLTLRGGRYNRLLHRHEWKVPYLRAHGTTYRVDGDAGLLEWFQEALRRGDLVDRYASQERPVAFSINYRWSPIVY